jgi:hypothetical protein
MIFIFVTDSSNMKAKAVSNTHKFKIKEELHQVLSLLTGWLEL